MKNIKLKVFLIFFLALFLFSPDSLQAKDNEWTQVKSKNFYLIGDADAKEIKRVATKLEQFRETFQQIFKKLQFNSSIPTTVIVFKNEKSFKPYKPKNADGKVAEWMGGYFQGSEDANYIVLSTEGEKEATYQIIFHEYIHYLVDTNFGKANIPPWFNEGLAEYYERFLIENDQKVTLGGLNIGHLDRLAQNKLIPFENFFNIDYYSLNSQKNHGASMFYAQSWALMHYLMQGNNQTRAPQLNVFLDSILKGTPVKPAFESAFKTDFATMEAELKKYVSQNSFRVSVVTFKQKLSFDSEMQASPLSQAASYAYLGDLLTRTRNRLEEAENQLKLALSLDPNSSMANSSLGLLKMKQKKFPEAKEYLEKAIANDAKNFRAYYNYAYVLSREGMTDFGFINRYDGANTEKMRDSLKKAIELNPEFAESYHLMAFINLVRNEMLDESIAFIKKAIQIAPGNQWFMLRLAELYARKHQFEDSRKIASRVLASASDDQLKLYTQNFISMMNSLEQQLAAIENRKKNPPLPEMGFEKPLTEEEIQKRNREAEIESMNQALRKPKKGEKRITGYLKRVDCQANNISFLFKTDNAFLKLTTTSFDKLTLMTFNVEVGEGTMSCGEIKKETLSVITYKPSQSPKGKSDGELISIEFVSSYFKLLP